MISCEVFSVYFVLDNTLFLYYHKLFEDKNTGAKRACPLIIYFDIIRNSLKMKTQEQSKLVH